MSVGSRLLLHCRHKEGAKSRCRDCCRSILRGIVMRMRSHTLTRANCAHRLGLWVFITNVKGTRDCVEFLVATVYTKRFFIQMTRLRRHRPLRRRWRSQIRRSTMSTSFSPNPVHACDSVVRCTCIHLRAIALAHHACVHAPRVCLCM